MATPKVPDPDTGVGRSPGRRKVQRGPTALRLAQNVRRLREQRGLTVRELSDQLAEVGHPIFASGLTNLENGTRGVDVDDLMALAWVLGVTPNALLLGSRADDEALRITEQRELPARLVWQWARGNAYVNLRESAAPDLIQEMRQRGEEYRAWWRENRPDALQPDPEDLVEALDRHRDLLEAVVDAEMKALAGGIPLATVLDWADRQRLSRHQARRLAETGS